MYFYDNYYSLTEIVKLAYSTVTTKLFFRGATIIRRPFYLRGKPRFQFGAGFSTGYNCRIEVFGEKQDRTKRLIIGNNCHIGDNVHIAAAEKVTLGDNCLLASKIFISDLDHGNYGSGAIVSSPETDPNQRPLFTEPVTIGNNVWIGENVCILKGVEIGDGSIIGANAVVTRSIPPCSIAVGAPARVVKTYNSQTNSWDAAL